VLCGLGVQRVVLSCVSGFRDLRRPYVFSAPASFAGFARFAFIVHTHTMPHLTHNGVRIWWEEHGAGDPVLLIMGLGATLEWWSRLTPSLTARYRTILFDNRGAGKSDVPPGPYSIPAMADEASAVVDAAGVTSAHVIGLSMGGYIAQELVLRHPGRVRSLVLGCTSCGGRRAVRAAPEVGAALAARAKVPQADAMWGMVPYTFDASTPRERIAQDLAMRMRSAVSTAGYVAQLDAVRAWGGALDRLSAIVAPTLVIHGENDQLVPPENGRILAGAIPGARLVMLPHASHIFLTDQLEPARDAILSFLDQASGLPAA
jgi:pimeloyl-ACP methyl ester carboxylesterase